MNSASPHIQHFKQTSHMNTDLVHTWLLYVLLSDAACVCPSMESAAGELRMAQSGQAQVSRWYTSLPCCNATAEVLESTGNDWCSCHFTLLGPADSTLS